jgi:ADP-ribose pyrophosphatase YjhB (NUDIX family)
MKRAALAVMARTRTRGLADSSFAVHPRSAVAVSVRRLDNTNPKYVLVQRGKPPGVGMWSLPGGKIELGEPTAAAARRELLEETGLGPDDVTWAAAPFTTTDAIDRADGTNVQFHYVIAQTFCELRPGAAEIRAGDDALAASWWTRDEIAAGEERGEVAGNVLSVLAQAEALYAVGLFDFSGVWRQEESEKSDRS